MYPFSKLKSVLYMGHKRERYLTKRKKGEHLLIISKFSCTMPKLALFIFSALYSCGHEERCRAVL